MSLELNTGSDALAVDVQSQGKELKLWFTGSASVVAAVTIEVVDGKLVIKADGDPSLPQQEMQVSL